VGPRLLVTRTLGTDTFLLINVSFVPNIPGDEDITCSDTTTLATFDSKVKQFFVMIVFDSFDELMLRLNVCSFSFLEIHTWIKKSIKHTC
jgi:hypothetical protein